MRMKELCHPGEIIKHSLQSLELNVTDAAQRLGVARPTLSRVINAKASISSEMAIRVSKALGSTPEHWLRMQMAYDLAKMRDKMDSIHIERFEAQMAHVN